MQNLKSKQAPSGASFRIYGTHINICFPYKSTTLFILDSLALVLGITLGSVFFILLLVVIVVLIKKRKIRGKQMHQKNFLSTLLNYPTYLIAFGNKKYE